MALDVFEYLNQLDQGRFRAVIWHAQPEKGSAMSSFLHKVSARANGKYLDLLDLFIQNQELSESIDRFSPEQFRALMGEHSRNTRLLLVDRADFILDTWRVTERQSFYRMLKDQWDGYREGMQAKLVVALQSSAEIEKHKQADSEEYPRILRLADFNDIL